MPYPKFHPASTALVKTCLTPEIYTALKDKKTDSGFSIDLAMASGLAHKDSSIGIYAGDSQSYDLFSPLFDPIIRDYHKPEKDFRHNDTMHPVQFASPDPDNRFIRSARIRVARNIASFPFTPRMSRSDRLKVCSLAQKAFDNLPRPLSGTFTRYDDLDPATLSRLVKQKLAFPKGDRFQESAGINRDFPAGRGVFLSRDHRFRGWVNEEDHLRIMAQDHSADIAFVFNTLVRGLSHLSASLNFSHDPRLGFLNACPTNIGTAMRAGVHIHLPGLGRRRDLLTGLVADHHLQIRGTMGEKTAVEDDLFDISNARRLGVCANDIITSLCEGLLAIIQTEKQLA